MDCQYQTRPNETRQSAQKRKNEERLQKYEDAQAIYEYLSSSNEERAMDVFRRIRSGQQPSTIVAEVKKGVFQGSPFSDQERQAKHRFMVALAQSNAPLDDILHAAEWALEPANVIHLSHSEALGSLKHLMITLNDLGDALAAANPDLRVRTIPSTAASQSAVALRPGPSLDVVDDPPFWVPASPWTTLDISDNLASHLVSLFLTVVNPYWRFLEADVFVKAMREGNIDSEYCSPFLVSAVLSCGSYFSNDDRVFVFPGQLLTRGEHLHAEAMRLWSLHEQRRPTPCTIQALMILGSDYSWRGTDRPGWDLLGWADQLFQKLPPLDYENVSTKEDRLRARVRACLAHSSIWLRVTWAAGVARGPQEVPVPPQHAPPLSGLLPDEVVYWSNYPTSREPVAFPMNRMTLERWNISLFTYEMLHLLPSKEAVIEGGEAWKKIEHFAQRLQGWYDGLPSKLHRRQEMPSGLYEFHSQYLWTQMRLYDQWSKGAESRGQSGDEPAETSSGPEARLQRKALSFSREAATFLRGYRTTYGYKTMPPFLFHAAATAGFIFVNAMRDDPQRNLETPPAVDDGPIESNDAAFRECFRLLLAAGVQQMLPRGIGRLLYQSAINKQVQLPDSVVRMLNLVAETSWEPSDIERLDSMYPDPTLFGDRVRQQEDFRMNALLKKYEQAKIGDTDGGRDGGAAETKEAKA